MFLKYCQLILATVITVGTCNGQFSEIDSLKPAHRIQGNEDTLDYFLHSSSSILPGLGIQGTPFLDPFQIYQAQGSFLHSLTRQTSPMFFTALPYLGFAYGFGTQGSQHLHFDYFQAFRHNWLLNGTITSNGSNGFLRNNAWSSKLYSLKLQHVGSFYSMELSIQNSAESRQFSGGLINDSSALQFPLGLLPVLKDSCRSEWRVQNYKLSHRFDIFGSDSLRFLGIYLNHGLEAQNRKYFEQDTLWGLYPVIYGDSSSTSDRFEKVSALNDFGFRFQNSSLDVAAGMNTSYWRMRMGGNQRDTLELDLNATIKFERNKFELRTDFSKNLFGNFGQWYATSSFKTSFSNRFCVKLNSFLGNVSPNPLQRMYYGNTLNYSLNGIGLQRINHVRIAFEYNTPNFEYCLQSRFLGTNEVYIFSDTSWNNSTSISSIKLVDFLASVSYEYKALKIKPFFSYLVQSELSRFTPKMSVGARFNVNGTLLKSKKLNYFLSLQGSYAMQYKVATLNYNMGILDVRTSALGTESLDYSNISMTFGIKVKTFRFFVNGNNLGVFWMDKSQNIFSNYTIPSWQLKCGITWDFWN